MSYRGGKVVNIRYETRYDIYIGRGCPQHPQQSKWHNPYHIGKDGTRPEVIKKFKIYLFQHIELLLALDELEDQILACHCKRPDLHVDCHGDFLRDMANANKFFRRLYKIKNK